MAATARVCPHCSSRLEPVAGQARLRCRGCNKVFALASSAPPPAPTSPPPGTRTIVLLTAGSALLLALVVGGFLVMVLRGQGDERAQAGATDRRPWLNPPADTGSKPAPAPATEPPPPPRPEPPAPPPQPVNTLTEAEQQEVNQAIERGVAYLKSRVAGARGATNLGGYPPFVGLTLLECGVPPEDEAVRWAVRHVRAIAPQLTHTYTLALSILFLDRLGDPEDEPRIQRLAMRLVAGQNAAGGWTYQCPALSEENERQLTAYLESHGPTRGVTAAGGPGLAGAAGSGTLLPVRSRPEAGGASPAGPGRSAPGGEPGAGRTTPMPRDQLPGPVRDLAVVRYEPGQKMAPAGTDDNSNTQFATLGVWAARRHGVPVDRTLALIAARFHASQHPDGTWGYHLRNKQNPDSMTCAGLLGLAVGRATPAEAEAPPADDPAIAKGLKYLGNRIGKAGGVKRPKKARTGTIVQAAAHGDLYYLWSIERVGMLYNLSTIGGKDWYAWGAGLIVDHQKEDGSWNDRHGAAADTCFALLFLKRVNVAKDLTMHLQRVGPIRDPGESRTVNP